MTENVFYLCKLSWSFGLKKSCNKKTMLKEISSLQIYVVETKENICFINLVIDSWVLQLIVYVSISYSNVIKYLKWPYYFIRLKHWNMLYRSSCTVYLLELCLCRLHSFIRINTKVKLWIIFNVFLQLIK